MNRNSKAVHLSQQLDTLIERDYRKNSICNLLIFHWCLHSFLHPTAWLQVYWHSSFFSLQTSPFCLCTSISAKRNRSKYRTKNQVAKQHNTAQYMFIFCSKWMELTKIVWKKTHFWSINCLEVRTLGELQTESPKNRGITDSSPVFQRELFEGLKREITKALYLNLILSSLEWGKRTYKPIFNALSPSWN